MSPNQQTDSAEITRLPNFGSEILSHFKPKLPRPDQINWPRSQRKSRKNARRAFAAGNRHAFNK